VASHTCKQSDSDFGGRSVAVEQSTRATAIGDRRLDAEQPPRTWLEANAERRREEGRRERSALELDRRNVAAARKLGRLLIERGDTADALSVLSPFEGDFVAEGLAARAQIVEEDGATPPGAAVLRAFDAWDQGDCEAALESLQEALAEAEDPDRRDLIRKVMVAMFTELGADHPLAREHRRRVASALN